MATEIVETIGVVGTQDYTTIGAWEAATQLDLVTRDEVRIGELTDDEANPYAEKVTIAGAVVDSTRFRILRASATTKHNGDVTKGSVIKFPSNLSYALRVDREIYFKAEDIRVDGNGFNPDGGLVAAEGPGGGAPVKATFINILVHNTGVAKADMRGFYVIGGKVNPTLINFTSIRVAGGFRTAPSSATGGKIIFYNCAAYNCTGVGFDVGTGDPNVTDRLVNCLAKGNATDFSFGSLSAKDVQNCASSDATADDAGGTGNRVNQTFTFIDEANDKYVLDSDDEGAKGFGQDLSGDSEFPFTFDIANQTRNVPWDIGPYKALSAGQNRMFLVF